MGGKNLVLNTPTGSGKSLVATALHFKALAEGKTSVYTTPIKALANEKFFALCQLFALSRVGMLHRGCFHQPHGTHSPPHRRGAGQHRVAVKSPASTRW